MADDGQIEPTGNSKRIFILILAIAVLLTILGTWSLLTHTPPSSSMTSNAVNTVQGSGQSTGAATVRLQVVRSEPAITDGVLGG